MHFSDNRLARVWARVQGGERLSREDGLLLFDTEDLLGVGRMAGHAKARREGDRVYFVVNRYISPTNVCVLSCAFCGFARKKGAAGAFEYTVEEIIGMVSDEVREVQIVGGHHPDWPFEYCERVILALHAARPEVQIKAFTAAEIDYFCRRWKLEPWEGLTRLKAAGLQMMPGGGAEIFSPRLAKLLKYTGKADPDRWCQIHGIAHSLGIKTNATMLYGHVETLDERVHHMAGAETPAGLAREQLFRMIRDAGKVPVERDALYNVVGGPDTAPPSAQGAPGNPGRPSIRFGRRRSTASTASGSTGTRAAGSSPRRPCSRWARSRRKSASSPFPTGSS